MSWGRFVNSQTQKSREDLLDILGEVEEPISHRELERRYGRRLINSVMDSLGLHLLESKAAVRLKRIRRGGVMYYSLREVARPTGRH